MLHFKGNVPGCVFFGGRVASASLRPVFAALLLLVALAGCAQFPKQAYNREANTGIKRIALLEPAKPDEYSVVLVNHPGNSFGLIGGLIAAADIQTKTNKMTEALKARNVDFATSLTKALQDELGKDKYEVVRLDVERPDNKLFDDYSKIHKDEEADAYLDWVINWQGFLAGAMTTDYTPSARVVLRLVSTRTKEVLYSEMIGYGFQLGATEALVLPADLKYRFPQFSDLMEKPDLAAEGLMAGIPKISQQVGADLARVKP